MNFVNFVVKSNSPVGDPLQDRLGGLRHASDEQSNTYSQEQAAKVVPVPSSAGEDIVVARRGDVEHNERFDQVRGASRCQVEASANTLAGAAAVGT